MQSKLQFELDTWRLILAKKFDTAAQKEFDARIQEILANGYTKVELNLNLVEFINSSGLGHIATTYSDLKTKGVHVTVVGISEKIQGMLDRHGLSDLLATV